MLDKLLLLLLVGIGSIYPLSIPREYEQMVGEFVEEKYAQVGYDEKRLLLFYKEREERKGISFSLVDQLELKKLVKEWVIFPVELYFKKEGLFERGLTSIIARGLAPEAFESIETLNRVLHRLEELDMSYIITKEAYREEIVRKRSEIAQRIEDMFQRYEKSRLLWAVPIIGGSVAAVGLAVKSFWGNLKQLRLKTVQRNKGDSALRSGGAPNQDGSRPTGQDMPLDLGYGSGAAVARGGGPRPITIPTSRSSDKPAQSITALLGQVDVVAPGEHSMDFPPLYKLKRGKRKEEYRQEATDKLIQIIKQDDYDVKDVDSIRQLLEEGADPNAHLTPANTLIVKFESLFNIYSKLSDQKIGIFKLLLDYGARIRYQYDEFERDTGGPHLLVLERGVLMSNRSIGTDEKQFIRDRVNPYPLISTVVHEDVNELKTLLNQDASPLNVNKKDNYGRTALHWAMALGDSKAMMLLLRAGADDTIKNKDGLTPLEMALRNGNMMMQWVVGYEEQEKKSAGMLSGLYRKATERYQDMLDTYYMYKNSRYIPTMYNFFTRFTTPQHWRLGPDVENKIAELVFSPVMYRTFLRYRSTHEAEIKKSTEKKKGLA
jgi:Ankyrin repeats (many copies)